MKKIKFYIVYLFALYFILSASFCGSNEHSPKSSSSTESKSEQNEPKDQTPQAPADNPPDYMVADPPSEAQKGEQNEPKDQIPQAPADNPPDYMIADPFPRTQINITLGHESRDLPDTINDSLPGYALYDNPPAYFQEIENVKSAIQEIKETLLYYSHDFFPKINDFSLQIILYNLIFNFCNEAKEEKEAFFNKNFPYDIDSIRKKISDSQDLIGQLDRFSHEIDTQGVSPTNLELVDKIQKYIGAMEKEIRGIEALEEKIKESLIRNLILKFNEFINRSEKYAKKRQSDVNYNKTMNNINYVKKLTEKEILGPIEEALKKMKNKKVVRGFVYPPLDFEEIKRLFRYIISYQFPKDHPIVHEIFNPNEQDTAYTYIDLLDDQIKEINFKLRR